MPYADWAKLDDPIIDISVTPNRGDCFSVRGVARDLAAAGLGTLKPFAPPVIPPMFDGGPRWAIEFPDASLPARRSPTPSAPPRPSTVQV